MQFSKPVDKVGGEMSSVHIRHFYRLELELSFTMAQYTLVLLKQIRINFNIVALQHKF